MVRLRDRLRRPCAARDACARSRRARRSPARAASCFAIAAVDAPARAARRSVRRRGSSAPSARGAARRVDDERDLAAHRVRAARAATSAGVPAICCSCSLVNSRTTKMRTSGATAARSASAARDAVRRLVPDARDVRAPRAARKAARRAPRVRGGKPSNTKRRTSKPESTAAHANAVGPGSTSTAMPAARAAATRALPGSLIPGIPASVTTATSPLAARSRIVAGRRGRVVLVVGPERRSRRCRAPRAACARRACLRRRSDRPSRSASSARNVTSRRLPERRRHEDQGHGLSRERARAVPSVRAGRRPRPRNTAARRRS